MITYPTPLVPGPVTIAAEVLAAYAVDYGSADLEEDFFALYETCAAGLQQILETQHEVTIHCGEGMLALWSALKSVLQPEDRVLAISTGLFGAGIGDMARRCGASVEVLDFGLDGVADADRVRQAARRFRPQLITAVHCETPSGTLTELAEIGAIAREVDALFYVDFVASAGGTPVRVDANQIDLGLLGSQKVLSLMPDLSMISVSERAWDRIAAVDYAGYDALKPWRHGVQERYLPYTHNWHAMAGLRVAIEMLLEEGLTNVFERHARVAAHCRARLADLGIELFPRRLDSCAPTVTAAKVPPGWSWDALNTELRAQGVVMGGNYGPLAGKVFRIGHMGNQAQMALVDRGLDSLESILK